MTHNPRSIFLKPLCKRKFIWLRAKSIMFDWLRVKKKNRRVHDFFSSNEKLDSISCFRAFKNPPYSMQCIICMFSFETDIMFAIKGNIHTFNQASFNVAWLQILLTDDLVKSSSSFQNMLLVSLFCVFSNNQLF